MRQALLHELERIWPGFCRTETIVGRTRTQLFYNRSKVLHDFDRYA
jgi:hypothetical protein